MTKRNRKSGDFAQRAWAVVEEATSEKVAEDPNEGKDPVAVETGRVGGRIGGKARADKLTAERRSEIARNAARARWGNS